MGLTITFYLQLTTGGYLPELAGEALKALQNGIAFKYAKALLVSEVCHIFPSVAGVNPWSLVCTLLLWLLLI